MRIAGVMCVRNEADILAVNIAHHRAIGVSEFWVIEGPSTDETPRVLKKLAASDPSIRWSSDTGAFRPGEIATELAREASKAGADWILPIDADEFWVSKSRPLPDVLAATEARAIQCYGLNFIQSRKVLKRSRRALLTMTYRSEPPIDRDEAFDALRHHRAAFVELQYGPKWIRRASTEMVIDHGNHLLDDANGPFVRSDELVCLHASIRARESLESKVDRGRREQDPDAPLNAPELDWHAKRWTALHEIHGENGLDAEWRANSYEDGFLDVWGSKHPVVVDTRLRDAVAPHIRRAATRWPRALWPRSRARRASAHLE